MLIQNCNANKNLLFKVYNVLSQTILYNGTGYEHHYSFRGTFQTPGHIFKLTKMYLILHNSWKYSFLIEKSRTSCSLKNVTAWHFTEKSILKDAYVYIQISTCDFMWAQRNIPSSADTCENLHHPAQWSSLWMK